jgi:GNAT superfamily N-acetyltransferase
MPVVDVKVYYLEMTAKPGRSVPPPREGLAIVHAKKPTVAYYRFLYNNVGKDYHWFSRGKLSDPELAAGFLGQGLGRYFLQWTIGKAWSYQPRRFWLHTCTLDHPAALPTYQKAGFTFYKEEMTKREI